MKRLIIILAILLAGCANTNRNAINVYNWGDFIAEDVIEMFTNETGIEVNYNTFASNEDAYTKIKNGGDSYDVVILSDYMIDRMINEKLLSELDFANVPNYSHVHERFKHLPFDSDNQYSVPYMWGTVGILYNKKMVDKPISWNALWNEKYKNQIYMYDSQRDALGVALKKLGYSLNTCDINELHEAKLELVNQKKLVQAYVGDAVKDKMIACEGALAVVYSGDALFCMQENSDLDYVIPIEGSNAWYDSMVIPKNTQHKKLAEAFINFMTRPDIAKLNTQYIGYSTVNKTALKELPELNNKTYWPDDDDFKRCEIYRDLGSFIKYYDRIWTEVLAED